MVDEEKIPLPMSPSLVKSILHPTDFSPASERAFGHALAMALLGPSELTILHVGPEHKSKVEWRQYPHVRQTLERWGLLAVGSSPSAVLERLGVKVSKIALRSRHPVLATGDFLDHEPTNLIVLGTEGREGVKRWFKPSSAEAIARWSRTMTLFVPAHSKRDLVSLEDGQRSLKSILVPVDSQPDGSAAVAWARWAALVLGDGQVSITLLHVGHAPPVISPLESGAQLRWNVEQRQGIPVKEILSAADRHKAELLVMATAGHDGVWDALRGSTTEQVLRRAPCPLLAVPVQRKFKSPRQLQKSKV